MLSKACRHRSKSLERNQSAFVLPRSKYVETTLEHCRRNFKTVVPLPPINQVQTLMKVLWGALFEARTAVDSVLYFRVGSEMSLFCQGLSSFYAGSL